MPSRPARGLGAHTTAAGLDVSQPEHELFAQRSQLKRNLRFFGAAVVALGLLDESMANVAQFIGAGARTRNTIPQVACPREHQCEYSDNSPQ